MDNETVKDLLREITTSVLESAAFLFVDEEKIDFSNINETSFRGSRIQFSGFKEGKVFLWMTEEIVDVAARNMLGYDDDYEVNEKQRDDVLMEILNMVTGNLLTGMFGENVIFKLSIPEIINSEDVPEILPETTVIFSIDEAPLLISIEM
jgi:CheY-specific phosphatase CheX